MEARKVQELVKLVTDTDLGYNYEGKQRFRSLAISVLKMIRDELGIEADIRWNEGGYAVPGNAYLHGDHLYIDFGVSVYNPLRPMFMYRWCRHNKDYTGGTNRWVEWADLIDNWPSVMEMFRQCVEKEA